MTSQRADSTPLLLLAFLYITQFIAPGLLLTGLAAIYRQEGASLDQLASLQVLGIFWAIKFLWAPLMDRYSPPGKGHYRSWLMVLQPVLIISMAAMALIDPISDLSTLLLLGSVIAAASATQDIAADALAVRHANSHTRAKINSIQVAGNYLGSVIGAGLIVIIIDHYGWSIGILVAAAVMAATMWWIITYTEPQRTPPRTPLLRTYSAMRTVFNTPTCRRWALVVFPLYFAAAAAQQALFTPMLTDMGWTLTDIGIATGVIGSVAGIGGAILGGTLVSTFGRWKIFLTGGFLVALSAVGMMFIGLRLQAARPDNLHNAVPTPVLWAAIIFFLGVYSMLSIVLFAVHMDYSRPEHAGSDYTLLSSIGFVIALSAGALSLMIAQRLGYHTSFMVSAALSLIALVVAALMRKRNPTFLTSAVAAS